MAEKKYGKYTEEQVRQANLVDLEVLLEQQGERLIRSGKEMRLERNHSVTVRSNRWYDHAEERGGYALSFVKEYMNMSFDEAMQLLIGDGRVVSLSDVKQNKRENKAFALPEQNASMRRLYAYLLNFRKVDKSVLNAFVQAKLIYEDKPYHNAVFVGKDENDVEISCRFVNGETEFIFNLHLVFTSHNHTPFITHNAISEAEQTAVGTAPRESHPSGGLPGPTHCLRRF